MIRACVALYWLAVLGHALALALGLAVLHRFGHTFRRRRSLASEMRYLTVALSTAGNVFLGSALTMYVWGGLATYLPPKLELVFACGHLLTAATPVIWHGLSYAELKREARCGTGC